jgi:Nucleotide modification associated domain 3
MNVFLLRVGIDTGCGGMAGPIFGDGSFEFIPIDSDRHLKGHTYGNLSARHRSRKLIDYFPERLRLKMQDCFVHDDPEFKTCTYGDPTRPKQGLRHLKSGDLLVFYAGLCGWGECTTPTALYIVGYFKVQEAGPYPELVRKYSKGDVHKTFAENYHIIHRDVHGRRYKRGSKSELVLVKGGPGSKLLNTAVRLSAPKKRMDRGGHRIFVLDPVLKKYFGSFTKLNAIQRSIPRRVAKDQTESARRFVLGLD